MRFGDLENGEAFGEVFFSPERELRLALFVFSYEGFKSVFGFRKIASIEDVSNVIGHRLAKFLFGEVMSGVLLKVKLASLPRAGVETGFESGFEAFVGIGSDEAGYADASLFQGREEFSPVDFGFGEGAGDTKDHAFAIFAAHSDGFEGGAVANGAVDTNFVVGGVEGEVANFSEGSIAPLFEFGVELGGQFGYLGGGDLEAGELFHDFGDSAGGDALEIHGGDGGFEGSFAT